MAAQLSPGDDNVRQVDVYRCREAKLNESVVDVRAMCWNCAAEWDSDTWATLLTCVLPDIPYITFSDRNVIKVAAHSKRSLVTDM